MSKVRVYEVAKQLGIDEQAAITLLQQQGAPVRNRLSAVEQDVADRAKRALERAKAPAVVEERIRPTVVRRKATKVETTEAAPVSTPIEVRPVAKVNGHHEEAAPAPAPVVKRRVAKREEEAPEVEEAREAREQREEQPQPEPVVAKHPTPPPAEPKKPEPAVVETKPEPVEHPKAEKVAPPVVETKPEAVVVEKPKAPEPVVEAKPEPVVEKVKTPEPPPPAVEAKVEEPPPPSAPRQEEPSPAAPRSIAPKTGIETWAGRPGVPMPQPVQSRGALRGPASGPASGTPMQRRGVQYDPRRDAAGAPGRPGMGGGPARGGAQGAGRPGMGMRGGVGGAGGMRGGRPGMGGPSTLRRPGGPPPTAEMSAHKKVIRIEEKITLATLASRMSLKATDVLMKLMQMGMTGVNINTTLDADTAKILASEFAWEVEDVAVSDEQAIKDLRGEAKPIEEDMEVRAPVVTVMGHVDHGKTSLLDYIRKAQVAAGEAGGITQHVGAYRVKTPKGEIAFLDTPGHEAFTAMRARGAQVTDIVILVVAADDGVMPQTREAVNHAKAAKVPIIVAVNKVDKENADPARPRRELMEMELVPEELGGETMFFDVSAKTGQGIDALLDGILLQAEVLELRANPKKAATGTVIEAMLDRGKGPVARILVRDGTLNVGDLVLAGPAFGKVRAMTDDHGRPVQKAGPATPVEILGLDAVPNAGDTVDAVKDARKAQELADARRAKEKRSIMPTTAKVSLEEIARRAAESGTLELRLIVKADVQGSVEAVGDALTKLSGEKVKVSIVHSAVGAITEGDVNLATASKAIIIGFNVRPAGKAAQLADTEGVQIRLYNIIYNAVDEVKKAMEGLLAPTLVEKFLGRAEVRQVFNISKVGVVAGCMVVDGTIKRAASKARLIRDGVQIWEGKISGLKHIKEDRKEVEKGFECGISLDNYNDVKAGDFIESVDVEEVAAKL
ncbi:MAG: translation initiation factor IF-2 [Polyangiales bacterium]